jgi:hypothetical protein
MTAKDTFKSLITDLGAVVDKDLAYEQIKQKIWPLAKNKKPTGYFEKGDKEDADREKAKENSKNTMELNHYIKWYLFLTNR